MAKFNNGRATLEDVVRNLIGIQVDDNENYEIDIICAFEDYEFEGESEIIVSNSQAYVNHEDAPRVLLETMDGVICRAWVRGE
jgi:hypothetical protein